MGITIGQKDSIAEWDAGYTIHGISQKDSLSKWDLGKLHAGYTFNLRLKPEETAFQMEHRHLNGTCANATQGITISQRNSPFKWDIDSPPAWIF